MYDGKYKNVDLHRVLHTLMTYMNADNVEQMCKDCSPGKSSMASYDKAYYLYEQVKEGKLHKPIKW